jgi:hypothetical protein
MRVARNIKVELLTSLMVASPLKVHHFPSPCLAVIRVTDARNWPLALNSPGVLGVLFWGRLLVGVEALVLGAVSAGCF